MAPSKEIVLTLEGKTFVAQDPHDKPRVVDTQVGTWLGYTRVRNVKKIIRGAEQEGLLPGILQRSTTERRELRNGGFRDEVVTEYWLTEEEALLVATRADTPQAHLVVRDMIRVYTEVRHRLEQSPAERKLCVDAHDAIDQFIEAATDPRRHNDTKQIKDIPALKRELKGLIGACALVQTARTGRPVSYQRVSGALRSFFGLPSVWYIKLSLITELRRMIHAILTCEVVLPQKGKLAKSKGLLGGAPDKQVKLFN